MVTELSRKLLITCLVLLSFACPKSGAQGIITRFLGDETHTDIEDNNRTADNRIIRGAYLTNQWYDNWVFGVGVGLQASYTSKDGARMRPTPSFDFTVTKWVTPTIGARFGLQGFKMEEHYPQVWLGAHYPIARDEEDPTLIRYKETYLHADMMLNVSSLIWGYRETRQFNVIPYIHAGFLRLGHPDYSYLDTEMRDREVAVGLGAITNIRLTNHVNATVDARINQFSGRYHDNLGGRVNGFQFAVGLSYTIHKWYWLRHTTAIRPLKTSYQEATTALREAKAINEDLQSRNEKLEANNTVLKDEKANLNAANEELKKEVVVYQKLAAQNPGDELLQRLANAEAVFFFDINSDRLGEIEMMRLENYIVQAWNNDKTKVFYIVGSADKGTGTESINSRLSRGRADGIRKILIRKYGIPASQVVVKASIISDKHSDGRLDRCVIFESE